MKEKINSYFAVLIITLFGAGASQLIIHAAYADTSAFASGAYETSIEP